MFTDPYLFNSLGSELLELRAHNLKTKRTISVLVNNNSDINST